MDNTALVRILGIVFVACLAAAVLILLFYDGDKVVALGFLGGVITAFLPGLLSFRQSVANNELQVATKAKVEAVVKQVDTNTALTEHVGAVAVETHLAVNSRVTELIETVKAFGKVQEELAAAMGKEQGIKEGREQAKQDAALEPQS